MLIASFVDRIPNLAGLARTCEVYGCVSSSAVNPNKLSCSASSEMHQLHASVCVQPRRAGAQLRGVGTWTSSTVTGRACPLERVLSCAKFAACLPSPLIQVVFSSLLKPGLRSNAALRMRRISEMVVADVKVKSAREFQAISVTAEQWVSAVT